MKKILIIVGFTVFLTSCLVDKKIIGKDELSKWSVKNDTIYYDTTSVAYYDHSEYELNPNHGMRAKIIQELSITQLNFDVTTDELIEYVHKRHKKQKVEIVVPRH
jgi:hypothetical protein|tara:strand:- start:572 stop:886 length:315 start_codon:yes stop_codon:yes gene_type:complete